VNFENTKLFYIFSCIILGFIILSPSLFTFFSLPEGERFSELWLLGSNQLIESGVIEISEKESSSIYLGVFNHMRDLEFYKIHVKFRNQFESLPDSVTGLPSPLEPVFEYYFFLSNNETWEEEFRFSFEEFLSEDNILRLSSISINEKNMELDKTVIWDEENQGFYCQFFFELWIYDSAISDFQFHNRYVSVWINLM